MVSATINDKFMKAVKKCVIQSKYKCSFNIINKVLHIRSTIIFQKLLSSKMINFFLASPFFMDHVIYKKNF